MVGSNTYPSAVANLSTRLGLVGLAAPGGPGGAGRIRGDLGQSLLHLGAGPLGRLEYQISRLGCVSPRLSVGLVTHNFYQMRL